MRNTSHPTGSSNVSPFLGIPRLLSSNKFVGASGRPDLIFPDILSFSLKASNTLLPISAFLTGFGSEDLLRTLAAFSFSLAVSFDLFGSDSEGEDMDPLEAASSGCVFLIGSTSEVGSDWLMEMETSGISDVFSVVSVVTLSLFETERGLWFLVCIGLLLKTSDVEEEGKWLAFRPMHSLGTFWCLACVFTVDNDIK